MVLQKYRLVDSHLRRWKLVLGTVMASFFLLASNVFAASTASSHSKPTALRLQGLTMETATVGWVFNNRALFASVWRHVDSEESG